MKKVIDAIMTYLFGKKYYVCLNNRMGTPLCEISSDLHRTYESAAKQRARIMLYNITYRNIDIVSFRTKHELPQVYSDNETDE